MATDSLGEYKVVVTADYSQLKSQFDAINSIIKSTSESITNSLSAASNTASSAMINSFGNVSKSIVSAMKSAQESLNGFNSVAKNASTSVEKLNSSTGATSEKLTRTGNAARSGSEGFRDYARRVREAEKAEEDFYKQQGKAIIAAEERAIAGRTAAHKSAMEEIFRQEDAIARKKQTEHNKQQRRIRNLQTQYNVTYGEINKYMQAHAKMSEAVFIRLQGKISAIADEMRKLGAMPVKANPLAGMDYNKYTSQFSKWNDFFASFKHHMTWMASAMAIGTAFAIPAKTISTIAEVERQMAQMKQVNHDVNESQLVLNNTTQAFIGIAQRYGQSVDDVIKAGVLWGRQYKDLNEVMKLTNLSAKLAVADNMDVGLANRAVESVINGYQRQGDAVNFANHVVDSWTKIAHNAQSSATDLAEALMRTGAAAKAVGVDFDTTNALASAMIKSTGRSGAEVGNALKSLFSSIHNDKAIKQLEALGIQMYQVDADGQKHFRNLHDVFIDLMITSHTTSKNMEKDLLAISGGRRKLAA